VLQRAAGDFLRHGDDRLNPAAKRATRDNDMRFSGILTCLALVAGVLPAADTLDIYVLDVEGGKAMIVRSPSGRTLLIDGGMPNARDLGRVAAAAEALHIQSFDVHLVTHYDVDHVGNVPAIYARFPSKLLVDHGPLLPNPGLAPINRKAAEAYLEFVAGKQRLSVKPGDRIPFEDVTITVVASNEEVIAKPLAGGGKPNAACPATRPDPVRGDDNAASIGTVWEFGKFRMADFGDLLQWAEIKLMCPANPIGAVDLLMVNHHGLDRSNAPALVHGLQPKAAIVNNGERKGISPEVARTLRTSPNLRDVWQLHYSTVAGTELNAPEQFLANMKAQDCEGRWIVVSARRDGSFTVTNSRNGFSKTYR
jgi:beta-lactamase superfamily II metal-dependent hydrolase